jgi:hypothetical protein
MFNETNSLKNSKEISNNFIILKDVSEPRVSYNLLSVCFQSNIMIVSKFTTVKLIHNFSLKEKLYFQL